jgi:hypothetical protein
MFGWFHRRWVKRTEYETMKAIYEVRIEAMEEEVEELLAAVGAAAADSPRYHNGLRLLRQIAEDAGEPEK